MQYNGAFVRINMVFYCRKHKYSFCLVKKHCFIVLNKFVGSNNTTTDLCGMSKQNYWRIRGQMANLSDFFVKWPPKRHSDVCIKYIVLLQHGNSRPIHHKMEKHNDILSDIEWYIEPNKQIAAFLKGFGGNLGKWRPSGRFQVGL